MAATVSASLAAAVVLVVASRRGEGDLGAFAFWTLPFAGVVALASPRLAASLHGRRRGYSVAAVVGGLAGLLWTFVVGALLGPFVLLFSFPIGLAWLLGGAAGAVAGSALRSTGATRLVRRVAYGTLLLVVAAALLLTAAAVLLEPDPGVRVELRADTSDAKGRAFVEDVVMAQPGVESVTLNDPHVLEIELADGVSDEQLAELRAVLDRSPVVDSVELGG